MIIKFVKNSYVLDNLGEFTRNAKLYFSDCNDDTEVHGDLDFNDVFEMFEIDEMCSIKEYEDDKAITIIGKDLTCEIYEEAQDEYISRLAY